MGRLFKLALLLLPLLQVEGKTLKLKPKSSNEKEIPQIVANPSDASVIRGERVVLECEAAPRSSVKSCSWSKSGIKVSMDSRHWLEGCSLVIDPVQGSDEGSYICSVKTSNSQLESRAASLEVMVEPGVPSILEAREGDWVEVDQGEELLLTCESQGGRPHAELQWRDAEGQRVFGHVQEHITKIGNFLVIEDFTPDYHNSVVKCIQEKFGGEARVLKIVRLLHDKSPSKNRQEDENEDPDIQDDQPAVAADGKMRRRLFTCVSDSEQDASGSPQYVWVDGKLETRVTTAKDEKGRGYKCTLLSGGLKKVKKIEKKLKVMSKDLKRFSRTLKKLTATVSDVT